MLEGGEPGMVSSFPDKPKGMHWRTYGRLVQEVADAEAVAAEHLTTGLAGLGFMMRRRRSTYLKAVRHHRCAPIQ